MFAKQSAKVRFVNQPYKREFSMRTSLRTWECVPWVIFNNLNLRMRKYTTHQYWKDAESRNARGREGQYLLPHWGITIEFRILNPIKLILVCLRYRHIIIVMSIFWCFIDMRKMKNKFLSNFRLSLGGKNAQQQVICITICITEKYNNNYIYYIQ